MTYEEAKKILNPDGDNVWRGAAEAGGVEIVAEACRVAVTALEKQIPKKPINLYVKGNDKDGYCPECGKFVDNRFLYCDCGQALIWDDAGGAEE